VRDLGIRLDGPAEAPVLVFANSLGTTSKMWDPQVRALSRRYRCVRYELRGHGGTDAPPTPYAIGDLGADLLAVLDEVGATRASVLGLSLGGTVGLWLAAHHPERVDRLVVACSRASWPPEGFWEERIAAVRRSSPSDLLEGLLGRWFTPDYALSHPELELWFASMLAQASPDGYVGCCQALAQVDLHKYLGAIRAPTLVLAGANDPAVSMVDAASLAAALPDASLQAVAPGAHLLNVEQPERFTSAVLTHLAGTALERGGTRRGQVLGPEHVHRTAFGPDSLSTDFYELITRYAWDEIWNRTTLDLRTRSAVTVALLVALGRYDELALHLEAARRNGLGDAEIEEVLLHTAIYCGVPAANSAFAVARRVLEGEDEDEGSDDT